MRSRRAVIALLVGVGTAGIVGASAATLGGLTGADLGAESTVVGGCDEDGVTVAYATAYNAGTQAYNVTAVTLSGVAADCVGDAGSLTLSGSGGTALATQTFTGASPDVTVTLAAPVAASLVLGVAVVISG